MNVFTKLQEAFNKFLTEHFFASISTLNQCQLVLNADPQRQAFGDLSSSAPLILAKECNRLPRDIATECLKQFTHPFIKSIDIAGPGFLNISLTSQAYVELTEELFIQGSDFFKPILSTEKSKISLEFVSANPTGPLHFGHGRGGIIGDVLGNVFSFLGHTVVKEFYINDAGSQIDKLAMSLIIRCQQELGIQATLPEDGYHGDYIKDLAQECITQHGISVLRESEEFFKEYAQEHLLANIKHTLTEYGITFDNFFSEKTLHRNNAIEHVINLLISKQLVYKSEGALWFASTKFGDDKDRVVKKATGEWTYVAADIAYLKNKIDRGFTHVIMILGHDHHSYAARLHAVCNALDIQVPLDVILYQLVKIKDSGKEIRMSKRRGTMIYLEDIIQTAGKDVARFFYLHRKADAQLDFDIDLALKKTEENPVYYIQYAYVRINSILNHATNLMPDSVDINENDARYLTTDEHQLLKKIVSLKPLLESIIQNYQTHTLTYYLVELAQNFHMYYGNTKIIDVNNPMQTKARLLVLYILKHTLNIGLGLMGISKPEIM
ncbi:MAG TPA: arginine--tRNA ligase [Patescibacteria group bacterium]|jgi:arginyl-tRNA synthetase|nr:arginine--tRNA ligase [Patescibacteria group bacterium]